jgi:hypothetical protein
MRDRLAGCIIGTNVVPPKPRSDVEWSHTTNSSIALYLAISVVKPAVTRPASFHFEIGQRLASLRGEEVLIVGSGNLVPTCTHMPGDSARLSRTIGLCASRQRRSR